MIILQFYIAFSWPNHKPPHSEILWTLFWYFWQPQSIWLRFKRNWLEKYKLCPNLMRFLKRCLHLSKWTIKMAQRWDLMRLMSVASQNRAARLYFVQQPSQSDNDGKHNPRSSFSSSLRDSCVQKARRNVTVSVLLKIIVNIIVQCT